MNNIIIDNNEQKSQIFEKFKYKYKLKLNKFYNQKS